jgi:hypothetical protein
MSAAARTLSNLNTHHGTVFSVLDNMVEYLMGQLCSVHLLKVKFINVPVQMSNIPLRIVCCKFIKLSVKVFLLFFLKCILV